MTAPDPVDLRGAARAGGSFDGARLRRAELFGADLRGASFRGANLRGADCRRANFDDADLTDADTTGADFRHASLRRVRGLRRQHDVAAELLAPFVDRVAHVVVLLKREPGDRRPTLARVDAMAAVPEDVRRLARTLLTTAGFTE